MPPDLEAVHAALERNDIDVARAEVAALVAAAPAVRDPDHHLALGRAAETAGEWSAAETAYNLVLRESAAHAEAHLRLAEIKAERGELEQAAVHRERLAVARPDDTSNLACLRALYRRLQWPEQERRVARALEGLGVRWAAEAPGPADEEPAPDATDDTAPDRDRALLETVVNPSDADVARFLALFSGREDVHARQWYSPRKGVAGYSPVEEPLTARLVRQHLFGDVTLGVYPIRLDGTCVFFAFDLDLTKAAIDYARRGTEEAAKVRADLARALDVSVRRLSDLGLEPLIEDSGYKGRHLWLFLERPETADLLFGLGKALRRRLEHDMPAGVALEVFPKQARRNKGKGYGNLIKLPLGIHRRTGRRAWLSGSDGAPHPRPFDLLAGRPKLTHRQLLEVADALDRACRGPGDGLPPWEAEGRHPPEGEPAQERPDPLPDVARPAPPPWTEADFDRHPIISHLLGRCSVLRELQRRALEDRLLSHDEQVVLTQILGHLPGGAPAANYLLDRLVEPSGDRKLKSPLRGNPISCAKVRKRIPAVSSAVACNCRFPDDVDHYPTPVLHLRTAEGSTEEADPEEADPELLARRYLALQSRIDRLKGELGDLQRSLEPHVRAGPLVVEGGELRRAERDGVVALEWVPTGRG